MNGGFFRSLLSRNPPRTHFDTGLYRFRFFLHCFEPIAQQFSSFFTIVEETIVKKILGKST